MSDEKWLHLFTSNIRDLYIADAVDLLAAPEGFIYQFRYQADHVQDDLKPRWHGGAGGLKGKRVIVHFSLQHANNFHQAAYVPLRTGVAEDVFVEGNTYVIKFKLREYAPLSTSKPLDKNVHDFTEGIRKVLSPSYPDYAEDKDQRRSVAYNTVPTDLLTLVGDTGSRFETVVSYMSEALAPDVRLFFRVAKIWGGNRKKEVALSGDGFLDLVAGNEYIIELSHFQAASRENATLRVEVMADLKLLTPTELTLRSRYDVMPIRVFAPFRDDEAQGQIVLTIKEPARGASLRIPVRVKPSHTHKIVSPLTAIVGALLAVIPAAAGTGASAAVKVWLAVGGALLLMVSTVARRGKGLQALK